MPLHAWGSASSEVLLEQKVGVRHKRRCGQRGRQAGQPRAGPELEQEGQ